MVLIYRYSPFGRSNSVETLDDIEGQDKPA